MRLKHVNNHMHKNYEFPCYNTNDFESLNSYRDWRDRSISPPTGMNFVANDRYIIKGDDKTFNTPVDITDIHKPDLSKTSARYDKSSLERHENITSLERYHDKNDSVPDFFTKSGALLENLKKGTLDLTGSSKIRDETLKSYEASSPELGRTKDTSAFLGTKMLNKISNQYNSSVGYANTDRPRLMSDPHLSLK